MLSLGLTGGIASGKSLVSARFRKLGAVVIDADALARAVVEPGTPGLAAVVREFGPGILASDGALDRPALGALVFGDPDRLKALNAITHPLVRAEAARLAAAAAPGQVVVQDIPLLVETGQGAAFHLVVVVDAPEELQLARMQAHRGMPEADARSRMAAQATRAQRLAAADVVIDNSTSPAEALAQVEALWRDRLVPFAANLRDGSCAAWSCTPSSCQAGPGTDGRPEPEPVLDRLAGRLAARIRHAGKDLVLGIERSATVPGGLALDVLVGGAAQAAALGELLPASGFPRCRDPETGAGATGVRRFCSADPGAPAAVVLRTGAPQAH
ncbi:dephospho-CoA kinase [Pseudarthrobacter sp. P1]|uniref:dephospho-CoA kinase n=1 Tax=Pseudarthrobacter sp. P1 TaxID=3418418 RepID=UPI003CEF569C